MLALAQLPDYLVNVALVAFPALGRQLLRLEDHR